MGCCICPEGEKNIYFWMWSLFPGPEGASWESCALSSETFEMDQAGLL